MGALRKFYSAFQDANPEKFNDKILRLKETDDVLKNITEACQSLESIKGVHFKKAYRLTEEEIYRIEEKERETAKNAEKNKDHKIELDYEETRTESFKIEFDLEKDETQRSVTKILNFPQLLDGYRFYINSVNYYPIFQLVDAESYKTSKGIIMRTALQPIVIFKEKIEVELYNSTDVLSNMYVFSKIFTVKLPIMLYYFAKMNVLETINYFSLPFSFIEIDDYEENDDFYYFKVGKYLLLQVPVEYIDEGTDNDELILLTFLNSFKNNDKIDMDTLSNVMYWEKKLGSNFTTNTANHHNKGLSVQFSFERLLDETTKRIIRVPDKDKKNIYSLIRWFLFNYNNLLKQNGDDLANKRLRLNESYIFPLLDKWTQGVLRILNGRNVTIRTLNTLFSNLDRNILVKGCVTSENLRYMNNVNSLDISNKLKITTEGPQSISNSKGEIKGKNLDPSMIGKVDLIFTSNADPGTTRMLTPFCELADYDAWHFNKEPNLTVVEFDEIDYADIDEEDFIINTIDKDEMPENMASFEDLLDD